MHAIKIEHSLNKYSDSKYTVTDIGSLPYINNRKTAEIKNDLMLHCDSEIAERVQYNLLYQIVTVKTQQKLSTACRAKTRREYASLRAEIICNKSLITISIFFRS